jgi:hypothetical protein
MAENKTLPQKFDNLHTAEESVRAALADLVDPSTGEAIAPGEFAFDATTRSVFTNETGRCVRKRVQIIPTPKVAP